MPCLKHKMSLTDIKWKSHAKNTLSNALKVNIIVNNMRAHFLNLCLKTYHGHYY